MSKKRPSFRRVKRLRIYDVGEAGRITGVTPATIRTWLKQGLPVVPHIRPMLIRGIDLIAYLKAQRQARKKPCGPGRIYCFTCKDPKVPALQMVDFVQDAEGVGSLVGLCPDCSGIIRRRTSSQTLAAALGNLQLSGQHPHASLSGLVEARCNPHNLEV